MRSPFLLLILLVIYFLFGQSKLFAQNEAIDKLKLEIEHETVDSVKAFKLYQLSYQMRIVGDFVGGLQKAEEGLALAQRTNNNSVVHACLTSIGISYQVLGNYTLALKYHTEALNQNKKSGEVKGLASAYNNLGIVSMDLGNYPKALEYLDSSLVIRDRLKDIKGSSICLNNIGTVYQKQGNFVEALDVLRKSLNMKQILNDSLGMGRTLVNMASNYEMLGNYPKALEMYFSAFRTFENLNEISTKATILNNLGGIYTVQKEYAKAKLLTEQALEIRLKIQNQAGILSCLLQLAVISVQLDNYEEATQLYEQSIAIAKQIKSPDKEAFAYQNLAELYIKLNRLNQVLPLLEQSEKIADNIGNQGILVSTWNTRSKLHFQLEQYIESKNYAEKALLLSQKSKVISSQHDAAFCLYRADYALGNFEQALLSHLLFKQYSDSLRNDVKSKQMGRIESQFVSDKELAQRDLQITRLDADKLRKDLILREEQNRSEQQRLTFDKQEAYLKADAIALEKQVESRKNQQKQDSLLNASRFERLEKDRLLSQAAADRNKWFLGSVSGGLLLLCVIAFTLFQGQRKQKRANNQLKALYTEIALQKEEISAANSELHATLSEVSDQRKLLQEQHLKIEDSIRYASRIQKAILPSAGQLNSHLPQHFIYYQPKDIVSGDFYWLARLDNKTLFAAVDCTGHGVPGAFMSLVGSNLLQQIVNETGIDRPSSILKTLDRRIVQTLHQQLGNEDGYLSASRDGMDVCLIILHDPDKQGNRKVEYAGAGRPLWLVRAGELQEFTSARYACGGLQHDEKEYPSSSFELEANDRLFLFSDGVTDQFGGPKGRKLGSRQLQNLLLETSTLSLAEQSTAFERHFSQWMGSRKQLDDVLLVGLQA